MMRFLLLTLIVFPAFAQIQPAQVTLVLDAGSSLRPVNGVPGSATVGEPVATEVRGFACSAIRCVVKTDSEIYTLALEPGVPVEFPAKQTRPRQNSRRLAVGTALAPAGVALIAVNDSAAFLYLVESGQFARFDSDGLTFLGHHTDGEILSLRVAGDGFDYAVAREDGTWIEHYSAEHDSVMVLASLGATGAVHLPDLGGVLVVAVEGVRWLRPEAEQSWDFDITGVGNFFALPGGFIQAGAWLLSESGAYALPPAQTESEP